MPAAKRLPWHARAVAPVLITTALIAAGLGLTGCATPAQASEPISVGTVYVPVPQAGTTVAYVVIRNNGAADRLVSAHTSAGGRVIFRAPAGPGAASMRTVPAIGIPAHSTLAMVPDGYHMLITDAGPMPAGKDITVTLIFAHAGPVLVMAQVIDPETGGSYYLS